MGQALLELELEVELCPEIFAAVEKITSHNFDVIVADWDDGPEASFLLKTSRELKSCQEAFRIAIAHPGLSAAAQREGADLVLSKPVVPEKAKSALFTCDEFLNRMKKWLARQWVEDEKATPAAPPRVIPMPKARTAPEEAPPVLPTAADVGADSQSPIRSLSPAAWPTTPTLTLPTSDSKLFRDSGIQSLFEAAPEPSREKVQPPKKGHRAAVRRIALGIAFFSAMYVAIDPARSQAVARTVTTVYEHAVHKTHVWLHPVSIEDNASDSELAQVSGSEAALLQRRAARIRVFPAPDPYRPAPATPPATVQREPEADVPPEPSHPAETVAGVPDSLKTPLESGTVRDAPAKTTTPSILGGMEPVTLSEDVAQNLLLEKVQPNYPEQAIKAGLQGPVVLQAWINKDGRVESLKLVRGYLVLGQAAAQAVKQWRYKPYSVNGQTVEAQTYVTVEFKLP